MERAGISKKIAKEVKQERRQTERAKMYYKGGRNKFKRANMI